MAPQCGGPSVPGPVPPNLQPQYANGRHLANQATPIIRPIGENMTASAAQQPVPMPAQVPEARMSQMPKSVQREERVGRDLTDALVDIMHRLERLEVDELEFRLGLRGPDPQLDLIWERLGILTSAVTSILRWSRDFCPAPVGPGVQQIWALGNGSENCCVEDYRGYIG
ncbi:predicted protein [Uncinocarpus reesii 1704]|uniref:Uncharacterized protein n=1 Tax=Uncinocarpus reesii (strain UAMH 1704) TaxID=336963 RepID=C4JXK6_UNCRE|nr:uncharacterized protein UREG_06379 [Uncinocarpus reesii 1704]EEP81514.1 predicted protein [Uncinocarpus reesii 1704]